MPTWKMAGVRPPETGHAIRVTVDGNPVAVFATPEGLRAVDARCSHVGGPLDQGRVSAGVVTCPLHGSQFDLVSGKVVRGPAMKPVRSYRARLDSGDLVLEAD